MRPGLPGLMLTRGAEPLVCADPPGPALLSKNQAAAIVSRPTGGSAADQGVRPTICAEYSLGENHSFRYDRRLRSAIRKHRRRRPLAHAALGVYRAHRVFQTGAPHHYRDGQFARPLRDGNHVHVGA